MRASRFVLPMLLATSALTMPNVSFGQNAIVVSITIAPPALPVYEQPVIPGDGYLWTPGYWAYYGSVGYYWVPGTWVQPPQAGLLWTPGYWGWAGGSYAFNAGYWAPHVGFYGGINYGFGYNGSGYEGGRWNNGAFAYNRAVNNVGSARISNVYSSTVVNNITTVNNISYNGGTGGVAVRPTAQESTVASERHVAMTSQQMAHVQAARSDHTLLATVNHGVPPVAATPRAAELRGPGVVQAKGAEPVPATAMEHSPVVAASPGVRPPLSNGVVSHAPVTQIGAGLQPRPTASPQAKASGTEPATATQGPPVAAHPTEPANTSAMHAPAAVAPHPQALVHPTEPAHEIPPPREVFAHAPAVVAAPTSRPAATPAHPAPEKRDEPG